MTDLNVALILRLVDRLSSPARGATRVLLGVGRAERDIGKASAKAAKGVLGAATALGGAAKAADRSTRAQIAARRSLQILGRETLNLSRAQREGAQVVDQVTRSTDQATRANESFARSEERAGEASARRFSMMDRLRRRGAAAERMLGIEGAKLDKNLGRLAMLSLASDGMARAGQSITRPLAASAAEQAKFSRAMTGIGVVGDLDDRQLVGVQANIFHNARTLGLPVDLIQQDDMAVLNEGVYRKPRDLNLASLAAARLSLLASIDGSELSGPEAGALISTYAHTLAIPAEQLDAHNAMLFRASQLGGDKIGDVARFMPTVMAQMKGRDFGNQRGFVDVLAAFQVVKRVAGTDEAAGVDLQDLMANLNHRLTRRRFAKIGINLDDLIVGAERQGRSPLEAVADVLRAKAPKDPKRMAGFLGELFQNQQAGQAAMALVQYREDGPQGIGWDTLRRQIRGPEAQHNYQAAIDRSSRGSWSAYQNYANAKTQLGVSTGTLLAPATTMLAGAASWGADKLTRLEASHSKLATAAVFTVGAVGILAQGLGALGHAALGVLAPMMIAKTLFGRVIPLAFRAGLGRMAAFAGEGGQVVAQAFRAGIGRMAALAGEAVAGSIEVVGAGLAAAGTAILEVGAAILGLLALPEVLIGLAVAAVVGLGVAVILNWGKVKTWISGFWDWLQKTASEALGAVGRFFGIRPPAWLATVASVAAAGVLGGPGWAAGAATLAASHPAPGLAPSSRPAQVSVTQHFHLNPASADPRALARELHRLGQEGQARALHDGRAE